VLEPKPTKLFLASPKVQGPGNHEETELILLSLFMTSRASFSILAPRRRD